MGKPRWLTSYRDALAPLAAVTPNHARREGPASTTRRWSDRLWRRVFVAVDDEGIAGFYSLSMFSIRIRDLPDNLAKRLPRYGLIPAALIGRLARHERLRGNRIGGLLVADAVARVVLAESSVAAWAIVVDAKNERVADFYRKLGFEPFPTLPLRLFMTMGDAAAAVAKAR